MLRDEQLSFQGLKSVLNVLFGLSGNMLYRSIVEVHRSRYVDDNHRSNGPRGGRTPSLRDASIQAKRHECVEVQAVHTHQSHILFQRV
jgi:hypothetical protein